MLSVIQSAASPICHACTNTVQSFDSPEYVCFFDCICVCAPPPLICLSRPHACPHASTSHTLALGRSGSTRDVPAKSSSTSSLDPNTCNTKPWQPPTSHYQSYSIYRRYSSLTGAPPSLHPPVLSERVSLRCSSAHHVFCLHLVTFNVQMAIEREKIVFRFWMKPESKPETNISMQLRFKCCSNQPVNAETCRAVSFILDQFFFFLFPILLSTIDTVTLQY